MNTYEKYIEETLKNEFLSVNIFKDEEYSKIELFEHKTNKNKVVKILSKYRNDHIFRLLRGTQHKNLPVIYDVCSCEKYVLVLESFVDGISLYNKIKNETITTKKAVKYILDICSALEFLHSLNIIHRDIKPQNIIIDKNDNAVLIDLQAARHISDTHEKDTVNLGTVGYAAPEQYGVYQSVPPTDIYAIGVLLNELIVKTHPTIKTPSGKLGKIIKKCTETQIYNRYQTVDKLVKDLKRYFRFYR